MGVEGLYPSQSAGRPHRDGPALGPYAFPNSLKKRSWMA